MITLTIINKHWYTLQTDPEIVKIMGTDTIPTPFSALMSAENVLQRVRTLNPTKTVVIDFAIQDFKGVLALTVRGSDTAVAWINDDLTLDFDGCNSAFEADSAEQDAFVSLAEAWMRAYEEEQLLRCAAIKLGVQRWRTQGEYTEN